MIKKINNKIASLAATAAAFTMSTGAASAQTLNGGINTDGVGIGKIADNVTGQIDQVMVLVVLAASLAGMFYVITGLLALKQANDSNGQQVKYSSGMIKIAVGAFLVASVSLTDVMQETVFGGSSDGTTEAKTLQNSFKTFGTQSETPG